MENIVEVNMILIESKDKEIISMTPVQIYDRVMACSQNKNAVWKFSASELYRVTCLKGFPSHYAREIQIAILNRFAELELNDKFVATTEDQDAINAIYSRSLLAEDNDENSLMKMACKGYLASMIEKATSLAFSTPVYPILDYDKLKNKWREAKFKEYGEVVVNFNYLLEILTKDFQEFIKSSREEGLLPTEEQLQEREEKNREIILQMIMDL